MLLKDCLHRPVQVGHREGSERRAIDLHGVHCALRATHDDVGRRLVVFLHAQLLVVLVLHSRLQPQPLHLPLLVRAGRMVWEGLHELGVVHPKLPEGRPRIVLREHTEGLQHGLKARQADVRHHYLLNVASTDLTALVEADQQLVPAVLALLRQGGDGAVGRVPELPLVCRVDPRPQRELLEVRLAALAHGMPRPRSNNPHPMHEYCRLVDCVHELVIGHRLLQAHQLLHCCEAQYLGSVEEMEDLLVQRQQGKVPLAEDSAGAVHAAWRCDLRDVARDARDVGLHWHRARRFHVNAVRHQAVLQVTGTVCVGMAIAEGHVGLVEVVHTHVGAHELALSELPGDMLLLVLRAGVDQLA
mmetsp:Transcript_63/g.219  ORF Transcript_63/g.219 Transcript_63/m.219 type:complete len:358 (+) Transcript_63:1216-2289(+)